MLFNLGMTADAAAAHSSEAVSPQPENQLLSSTQFPTLSCATLPSWGLGGATGGNKSTDVSRPKYEQRRSMPVRSLEPLSSDEEGYSAAGPLSAQARSTYQQSAKASSRARTIYQLAHPATNARNKRLKLRPKLLLQLQQVSQTTRPVPILDVLPSTLFMPKLTRKFPTLLRGKKGLGPNDLIITTSDLYERTVGDFTDKSLSFDEENGDHREVVATICQIFKEDALARGKAEICLNGGSVWEATPLPNGSYEFAASTDTGILVLRWVRRGAKKRRASAPPGSIQQEDPRRFTFSVIDPNTRRHPVIASMTCSQLEVYDKYSIPCASGAPSSPTSAMSVISDASDIDTPIGRPVIETDNNLRMLIIITGTWVAFREGWSPNFSYNDGATPKVARSPNSKATGAESDQVEADSHADKQSEQEQKRRSATWSGLSPTVPADSMASSGLSKRSNSTGAAFIERSNRRTAASNTRPNRHSMLASPREPEATGASESNPTRRNSGCCQKLSDNKKAGIEGAITAAPRTKASFRQTEAIDAQIYRPEASRKLSNYQDPPKPAPTKGKRRHRFSSLFDFIVRKSGNHHD